MDVRLCFKLGHCSLKYWYGRTSTCLFFRILIQRPQVGTETPPVGSLFPIPPPSSFNPKLKKPDSSKHKRDFGRKSLQTPEPRDMVGIKIVSALQSKKYIFSFFLDKVILSFSSSLVSNDRDYKEINIKIPCNRKRSLGISLIFGN